MTDDPTPRADKPKRPTLERRLKAWLGNDISTPRGRRRAWWATHLTDHAFLRRVWHNFDEVAPGVFRANQPDGRRLALYARMGIRTILSLRGDNTSAVMAFEREACARLGLTLLTANFSARKLREGAAYIEVLDLIAAAERPLLFHCKSGADRTGLIAALYLVDQHGRRVEEVRDQLSWRYIHARKTDTGVLDHMLEAYRRTGEAAGLDLRTWLREVYDPDTLTAEFRATPRRQRPLR